MASEKVAGATVSSLLTVFVERLASREFADLFREKKPIADLLEKLKSMLGSASSVINDAEDKKARDENVKNWVNVLKEVLCEANDVMDRINSEAQQREVEGRHPSRSGTGKIPVKGNPSLLNTFDNSIKPKIENTLERLKYLLDKKDYLGLREGVQSKRIERSPTRFIKNPRMAYGKDGKKESNSELLSENATRDDNMDLYGKDLNPNPNHIRLSPASHKSFYKSDIRKGLLSSPSSASSGRYDWDRAVDDDRESLRMVRKRPGHDFDGFDRRNGYDRYGGGGGSDSRGYEQNTMHRSKSFCGQRRDFPKGFRSERDRPRREVSAASWRRFGTGGKDLDERGKGLRDTRSSSWSNSRDSGSEQYRVRSPSKGYRDGRSTSVSTSILKSKSTSKSPTWSRDSVGSEQSKCFEVKKSEDPPAEKGSSSEMEEGELEPEPQPKVPELQSETEPESNCKPNSVLEVESGKGEVSVRSQMDVDEKEVESEHRVEDVNVIVEDKKNDAISSMGEMKPVRICEEKDAEDEVDRSVDVAEKLASEESNRDKSHDEAGEMEIESAKGEEVVEEKCLQSDVKHEEQYDVDLEDKAEDVRKEELDREITEENGLLEEDTEKSPMEDLAQNFKDKGKSVAVIPTAHIPENAPSDGHWIDRDAQNTITCKDSGMEGPSTRGFELFGSSPVRKPEKDDQSGANMQKDKKLGFESLDLTLSLPNVLLPVGAAPGSPAQSLSNTFQTNSDGFTASMSFSGSQSLYHNPSCSLTQTSLDNMEQSVKSRPIFQGIDWQALSQNEPKSKDFPLYQRLLANGNGSQSHQSQPNMNGQSSQAQKPKPKRGLERQLSFHNDAKSPSHSVGSHDVGSSYSFDRKRLMRREKSNGSLHRSGSSKMERDTFPTGQSEFVEAIISRIVSEPIQSMASKFNEMTIQSLSCLKDSIRAMIMNADKRRQISMLQKLLQDRSDTITLETLQKSHRVQLEILVALKTGLPDFVPQDLSVSSSELAEIFMNLRCKNVACRSHVPVDECDCKVCGQKNGFCSSCMCLVCSKFDMASNTCSWVGCDVCLHWCHTDCGLRESFIRNGRSASGSNGASEMQFHCVACDHPSEMFGFVKEVFLNFAKEWTAETFSKELECVKRIFAASKDFRGKKLHEIAGQMMARLIKKADLLDVHNFIIAFLNDSDSFKPSSTPLASVKEQSKPSNGIAGPSQEQPSWLKSVNSDKVPQLELPSSLLPSYNYDRNDKQIVPLDLQTSTRNEPLFDELESIVRIKAAEAKMFQSRADDARREAEGLQRIAIAKNEKIAEEYDSRIAKLRLVETEQLRKQKYDELQALERSHREYFNMKMRMEAEIKDLMVKMEATKRNLAA